MIYRVTHTTEYNYSDAVSVSHQLLHLAPRQGKHQNCRSHQLTIIPKPAIINERLDYFGNTENFCIIQEPHHRLSITAASEIDVAVAGAVWPDPAATPAWETGVTDIEICQYKFDSPYVRSEPSYADYARPSFSPGRPLLAALLELTGRIHEDFAYDPRATNIATPLEEVFEKRRGVCQDFAHLEIACLRSLGLPARYVSGYIQTTRPNGKERLAGADASHAWLALHCPGFGWIDIDPTNNRLPTHQHLTVAWGRDYGDVPPIRGIIVGGGAQGLRVAVTVTPLEEIKLAPAG